MQRLTADQFARLETLATEAGRPAKGAAPPTQLRCVKQVRRTHDDHGLIV